MRNVRLRVQTHKRLTRYLVDLQGQKGDPHMTMDDAVTALLEEHEKPTRKKGSGNPRLDALVRTMSDEEDAKR